MLDKRLLDILACPQCKGELESADAGKALLCNKCSLRYPIRENIPVLRLDAAESRKIGQKMERSAASSIMPRVFFKVINGLDIGLGFNLERQTCRAIGRGEAQMDRTMIFNVDIALSIDENTKALILKYISRQFKKSSPDSIHKQNNEQLGLFKRASDIVLTDHSLSRLHAMILADETGVGILDLVSKNGTYVNGEEVESRLIHKGDVIDMGETKILFEG